MITCINHVDVEDVENESGIFLCETDSREHVEVRDAVHHVQVQTGPLHETTQFQLQINNVFIISLAIQAICSRGKLGLPSWSRRCSR